MGVDYHAMKLLKSEARIRPLGEVLTFGRQGLHLSRQALLDEFGEIQLDDYTFVESFMEKCLGANGVRSLDNSNYEGATFVADLNKKVELGQQFDTIADFGTLEHVFNVAEAVKNAARLCRVGGRVMHVAPSSGFCGHGFYQFSPEFFLSLYSERNGFSDTRVYVTNVADHRFWYRVSAPPAGERVMVNSPSPTYALCVTTKDAEFEELTVQQSDYEHAWATRTSSKHAQSTPAWLVKGARRALSMAPFSTFVAAASAVSRASTGLTTSNPYLRKIQAGDP